MAHKRIYRVDMPAVDAEQSQDYFIKLLRMALEASKAADEEIEFRFAKQVWPQARWILHVQRDTRNMVVWTMTDSHRESILRPIRIPLFKGLFGKRVFIIRIEDQIRFDKVKNAVDLASFTAGQGIHWPDVRVLEFNDLPVTTAASVESLVKMLKVKRFDYFPRGVTEAWYELAQLADPNLVVEKNLMLVYQADIYYFVNKNNLELARRIETGLESMIASGEFDTFFHSHERVQLALEQVMREPRRMIILENPNAPQILPTPPEKYRLVLPARVD